MARKHDLMAAEVIARSQMLLERIDDLERALRKILVIDEDETADYPAAVRTICDDAINATGSFQERI